jgi:hypothetical protein
MMTLKKAFGAEVSINISTSSCSKELASPHSTGPLTVGFTHSLSGEPLYSRLTSRDTLKTVMKRVTDSRELSPSREATSSSAVQKFPNILQNLKVHYCVHKSPQLVLTVSYIIPFHTTPSYPILLLSTPMFRSS